MRFRAPPEDQGSQREQIQDCGGSAGEGPPQSADGTRPLYGFDLLNVNSVVGGVQSADDLDVLALILLCGLGVVEVVRAVHGLIFEHVAAVALSDLAGERFRLLLSLALARGLGLQRHRMMPTVSVPRSSRNGQRHERDGERSEEHTSELQSPYDLVCRLLLEKKKDAI